jgi:hypothetical protein
MGLNRTNIGLKMVGWNLLTYIQIEGDICNVQFRDHYRMGILIELL